MIKGFTAGAFDLLHAGQVAYLRECKKQCDHLVIGLHVNPKIERSKKHKPIESLIERQIKLRGCRYVDDIICYETEKDLEDFLSLHTIDIRFLGMDYSTGKNAKYGNPITGKDKVRIEFIARDHNWSSTELIERIKKS